MAQVAGGEEELPSGLFFTCVRCGELWEGGDEELCCCHDGVAQHWDFGAWKASGAGKKGKLMRRWSCCTDKKLDWGTRAELDGVPHGKHEADLAGPVSAIYG